MKKEDKNLLISMIVKLLIVAALIYAGILIMSIKLEDKLLESNTILFGAYALAFLFGFFGVYFITSFLMTLYKKNSGKFIEVEATCIKVESTVWTTKKRANSHAYSPVWEGKIDGKIYTFSKDEYSSHKYKKGDKQIIKVNPNNYEDYIDNVSNNKVFVFVFLGPIFICTSILLFYLLIKYGINI